ncbi:MAG: cytochrome [Gammaproteobacteria bacterium]|nr:cytochrome [Gammaproteobacteria bacterium]MBK80956.1 cytochrome [Gammaproteobacteria bacterium]
MDLLDPATFAHGHPLTQYAWLRDNAPAYWHEEPDGPGFWAVTRHEDVDAVGRDPATFSSEPTIMIADPDQGSGIAFGDHKMMLMMDPPAHTQFRKIISREFTRGPAQALRPRVEALAAQIVDAVIERGECDFVADVAGELPSYVIAELMGLPLDDGRKLYQLTEIIHSAPETLPEGAQAGAVMKMFEYAQDVYQAKLEAPSDDLASQIVHAEVEGRRLDMVDFQLFFLLLIDAGGDTTRNLVAGGLHALLDHPDALAALRADPSLIPSARDELLRWVSPVIYMRRTALRDTEIAGQRIRAGDKVVRYFGAANRDPRRFDAPDTLDIRRSPNPHIAFGAGTHVCLGQHIARVEIDCMLAEVVTRLQDIELAEPPEWLASTFISGIRRMPIRFTPGKSG